MVRGSSSNTAPSHFWEEFIKSSPSNLASGWFVYICFHRCGLNPCFPGTWSTYMVGKLRIYVRLEGFSRSFDCACWAWSFPPLARWLLVLGSPKRLMEQTWGGAKLGCFYADFFVIGVSVYIHIYIFICIPIPIGGRGGPGRLHHNIYMFCQWLQKIPLKHA